MRGRRTQTKGAATDQGLGRSRGGFTSQIVLTAADEDTAVAVDVVPSQRHEASHLEPMIDATTARVADIQEGVADKGFDREPQRQAFRDRNIKPVIPYKANNSKPGQREKKAYGERNMIERLIGKQKEFRRVATRYEKRKQTFLGIIHLATYASAMIVAVGTSEADVSRDNPSRPRVHPFETTLIVNRA